MDKKLYEQVDEVLSIRMLFPEKGVYEVLEMMQIHSDGLHDYLATKLEFLDDLKYVVAGLPLSGKLRKEFFNKACTEIEEEISDKAIVLAGQKFGELYDEAIADEHEEERLSKDYKLKKLEEFRMFVNSKTDDGIAAH
jgi:hypothetical protein